MVDSFVFNFTRRKFMAHYIFYMILDIIHDWYEQGRLTAARHSLMRLCWKGGSL